jgi:hypothetical protein
VKALQVKVLKVGASLSLLLQAERDGQLHHGLVVDFSRKLQNGNLSAGTAENGRDLGSIF